MTDTRRAPLVLLATCVFFAICTEVLPTGLPPQIGQGLGVSASGAGVLVSLYAVLVAVMSVPIAAVATRWPRRTVLAALLGAYTLSNVLFAVAPDYAVAWWPGPSAAWRTPASSRWQSRRLCRS